MRTEPTEEGAGPLTSTPIMRPTGRALGRRFADILAGAAESAEPEIPRALLSAPSVVPFDAVPFPMLVTDVAGDVLAVNTRWVRFSGLTVASSLGDGWVGALAEGAAEVLRAAVRRVAATGQPDAVDLAMGPGRSARWWLAPYERAGERLVGIAVADGRQRDALGDPPRSPAEDPVTGLGNRSHFVKSATRALVRSKRYTRPVGVVVIDVQSARGGVVRGPRQVGRERVLAEVAGRLRSSIRASDLLARVGEHELAVLCEDLNTAEEAELVARRIAASATDEAEVGGHEVIVGAAASVATARHEESPEAVELLLRAAGRSAVTGTADIQTATPQRPAEAADLESLVVHLLPEMVTLFRRLEEVLGTLLLRGERAPG